MFFVMLEVVSKKKLLNKDILVIGNLFGLF